MSGTRSRRVPWATILAMPLVALLASPAMAGGENGGGVAVAPVPFLVLLGAELW